MAGKIFINYRRGDDQGYTQAIYQRLEGEFAAGNLFMDVEGHIKPGDHFVEVLSAQVAECDILLVVIGPRWQELLAARAGDRDDFVSIEIKAALDQGKRVIPVLVGEASIPRADALPEPIRALALRNAVGLRPDRFRVDCEGLVTALRESLAAAAKERAAREDAARISAEEERKRREAEETARQRREAEEAQWAQTQSAAAVVSPEELAVLKKHRNDIQDAQDYHDRRERWRRLWYKLMAASQVLILVSLTISHLRDPNATPTEVIFGMLITGLFFACMVYVVGRWGIRWAIWIRRIWREA
jgi:hypothetical protein